MTSHGLKRLPALAIQTTAIFLTFHSIFDQIGDRLYGLIRDLFIVYLNRFEYHFLRFHINKTNTFCFFMHNGRVPGIAK